MAIVKLKTEHEFKFGMRNVLLHAGEIQFSETGEFESELTNAQLEDLLQTYPDLSLVVEEQKEPEPVKEPEEIKPQIEKNEIGKSADEDNDIGVAEDKQELPPLDSLSLKELKEIASMFPEKEWNKLSKEKLKEYLKNKLA